MDTLSIKSKMDLGTSKFATAIIMPFASYFYSIKYHAHCIFNKIMHKINVLVVLVLVVLLSILIV